MNMVFKSKTEAPVILIRLMVGAVFMSEGIQKFLFPADLGPGRFATIGLPSPGVLAPLVGTFEIGCGLLVVLGLLTRVAVIPLLVIILTAIWKTKLPLLLKSDLWRMAHEARTDWCMLLGCLFLLIFGAGPLALDARRRKGAATAPKRRADLGGDFRG